MKKDVLNEDIFKILGSRGCTIVCTPKKEKDLFSLIYQLQEKGFFTNFYWTKVLFS